MRRFLNDAGGKLSRLLLGISVREIDGIDFEKVSRLDYSFITSSQGIECSIATRQNSQEFHIPAVSRRVESVSEITEKRIETDFRVSPAVRSIHDTCRVEVRNAALDELNGNSRRMEFIEIPLHDTGDADYEIARPAALDANAVIIEGGRADEVDPFFHAVPFRSLEKIYDIPIRLHPTPWTHLERSFIVRCWDCLKNEAVGKTSDDADHKLEMSAVFDRVDMSFVRRTKYDPAARVLKIWPGDSLIGKKTGFRRCAIIIGFVRGTGRIIQVAMPLDNRR